MKTPGRLHGVAAAHDGESALASCPGDELETVYARELAWLSKAIKEEMPRPDMSPAQREAFANALQDRLSRGATRRSPFWAAASLMAAALVVAWSAFVLITGPPAPASATVVEDVKTEMEGVSVSFTQEDGNATVWVRTEDGDLW